MLKQLPCGLLVMAVSGGAWSGAAQSSTSVPREPAAPGYLEARLAAGTGDCGFTDAAGLPNMRVEEDV